MSSSNTILPSGYVLLEIFSVFYEDEKLMALLRHCTGKALVHCKIFQVVQTEFTDYI